MNSVSSAVEAESAEEFALSDEERTTLRSSRFEYQPALDGMRAVAVLAVLAYHGTQTWATGGFLGVDMFFVLSGYLITSLLLHEHQVGGRINLRQFYARRARRLLPALLLVLLAVAAAGALFWTGDQLLKLRGDVLGALGYFSNWRFIWSGQSYFDQFGAPSPLRHLWSLAIEEQWYFIWPAVLAMLLRARWSLRRILVATVALASGLRAADGGVVPTRATIRPGCTTAPTPAPRRCSWARPSLWCWRSTDRSAHGLRRSR